MAARKARSKTKGRPKKKARVLFCLLISKNTVASLEKVLAMAEEMGCETSYQVPVYDDYGRFLTTIQDPKVAEDLKEVRRVLRACR